MATEKKGKAMKKKKHEKKNAKHSNHSGTKSSLSLVEELEDHNGFFDMLVDMIPSKLYIAGASGDDFNPKYFKKAEAVDMKRQRKVKAAQAKRRKLDPGLQLSTTEQIRKRQEQQEQNNLGGEEDDEGEIENEENKREQAKENKKKNKGKQKHQKEKSKKRTDQQEESSRKSNHRSTSVASTKDVHHTDTGTGVKRRIGNNSSRIEALRAKLHAKIEAQRQHNGKDSISNPEQVSKRAARRAEKQRRRQEQQQKSNKKCKSGVSTNRATAGVSISTPSPPAADDNPMADLAAMDFGRLEGLNASQDSSSERTRQALQKMTTTKNLHKILESAQQKREKLQSLKRQQEQSAAKNDAEAAARAGEAVQKMQWKDTLQEANGVRVKDDPTKIKRALARKAARKQKSAKAWNARLEQQNASQKERQRIRQHNLKQRKQGGSTGANLSKKEIRAETSPADADTGGSNGRSRLSRAGFEGRKQDFLNGKSSRSTKKKFNH